MAASTPAPKKAPAKPGRTSLPKGVAKPGKTKAAPKVPKAAAVAKTQARQASAIPQVKGKVKPSMAKSAATKKPKSRVDMNAAGPLGSRNGSGSMPYQGSAPQSSGGIGISGFGG